MKLFFAPGACSLSPHIVAREAGLAFEPVKVDLRKKETADGRDFRTINPKGYVPALELAPGQVLTEGPAIVQYLADQAPEAGLAPAAGSFARYQLMSMLTFVGTEIHKQFSPLFNPATPEATRTMALERLSGRYALVNQELEAGPYLTGQTFSVADAYLFAVSRWMPMFKLDRSQWPALAAWFDRVASRPAVKQALETEGITA
ncbi:MAG: glutathione transferase GstA [Myxococcales bacterium]|nr:glutathione transferase GstA [Myxococcales bacterium]